MVDSDLLASWDFLQGICLPKKKPLPSGCDTYSRCPLHCSLDSTWLYVHRLPPPLSQAVARLQHTHTLLVWVTLSLQWLVPSHYIFLLCFMLFASCVLCLLWTCLFTQPWDRLCLLGTQTLGLPSYSNHLSPAFYSCYLMKLLNNMILLPSNAHSNVKSTLQSSPCPLPCPDYITADDIWKCASTPWPIYCR